MLLLLLLRALCKVVSITMSPFPCLVISKTVRVFLESFTVDFNVYLVTFLCKVDSGKDLNNLLQVDSNAWTFESTCSRLFKSTTLVVDCSNLLQVDLAF